jgi:hypothetical protein
MIRAAITHHNASYILSDGRVRPVTLAVVSRQVQRPNGRWRTTRQTVVDAGDATAFTARRTATGIAADIVEQTVEHGSLGTFNLADDDQRDAMMRAVRRLPTLSDRTPIYDCNDATGRGQLVQPAGGAL